MPAPLLPTTHQRKRSSMEERLHAESCLFLNYQLFQLMLLIELLPTACSHWSSVNLWHDVLVTCLILSKLCSSLDSPVSIIFYRLLHTLVSPLDRGYCLTVSTRRLSSAVLTTTNTMSTPCRLTIVDVLVVPTVPVTWCRRHIMSTIELLLTPCRTCRLRLTLFQIVLICNLCLLTLC